MHTILVTGFAIASKSGNGTFEVACPTGTLWWRVWCMVHSSPC